MELAEKALGSLLPKLATLLTDEYKLQKGVRGEIKFLQAEMEMMQAVLNKLSNQPAHQIEDVTKIWIRDLKELSCDIEDSVDAFMVRVDAPRRSKPHCFRRFFDRTIGLLTKAKNRHHIADDMQDIKKRIQEVADRRQRYKLDGIVAQPDVATTIDPRLPGVYEDVAKLVGIDGPAKKLTDLLALGEGMKDLKVVPIVGVGGLGKTTIANLVYERLGSQFDCQAFVSVSLKPNMRQLLGSILRQISKSQCTSAGEQNVDELIRNIRQFLKDKRYFVVIDDVWAEEEWRIIKCALVENNLGSKVIVTTRNINVANFSSLDRTLYELDPLSDVDSKKLLYKRVFDMEEGIQSEFEEISRKILKKCGGIPLAITTIASLLATKPNKTKNEWYSVYYSMGSGLEKNKTLDNMRGILYLSYDYLPSYLKPCLLYLSMFPEDFEIPRDVLVQMWIAEGFVDEKQGNNLYELGESYFNELVNRSMIQPVDIKARFYASDHTICCRVHDMVLDLIISLSAQENFVTISEGAQLTSQVGKIRRLSLNEYRVGNKCNKQAMVLETMEMSHVRTLFALRVYDALDWVPPLPTFSVLRVLALSCHVCPKDLRGLYHLRYLRLEVVRETELPEEIGNLKCLKILDLSLAYIKELPASIGQLTQLEHLLINSGVRLPAGIGKLISLQQLSWLNVALSPHTLAELGILTELRLLSIHGLGYTGNESYLETFLRGLSNLGNLHTLNFRACSLDFMPDGWRNPAHLRSIDGGDLTFCELPRWFSFLSELSSLSIRVQVLSQRDLHLLGALPVLRFIRLYVQYADERLMIGNDQLFPSLAEFEFNLGYGHLPVFGQRVMPKLRRLGLVLNLGAWMIFAGGFDIGLENLASLKHVTVRVDCTSAWIRDVEDTENKIRDAIEIHPNHPTLELKRYDEYFMFVDENEGGPEAPEQKYHNVLTTDDESDNDSEDSC